MNKTSCTRARIPVAANIAWTLLLAFAIAKGADRAVFNDYDTQLKGSDHVGTMGPQFFGDQTDMYSGATMFVATEVSLPGNSDLPVAQQRSLRTYDDGIDVGLGSYPSWTNFEVPYISGLYKSFPPTRNDDGWLTEELHVLTANRCSVTNGAPEVTQSSGKDATWEGFEYSHGNSLYLPGGSQEGLQSVSPTDPSNPTTGQTFHWATNSNWAFTCLPATKNGVAGEGFLGIAPDGKKYFFDWLVKWRNAPTLWKQAEFQLDQTVLQRAEYRLLVTRIEDRFGNWVNYTYSGKNLTQITANDGRHLTLTYDTAGTRVTSVTDDTRTWTYDYTSGVKVTYPDGSVWKATMSGPGVQRDEPSHCTQETPRYTGEYTLSIQHRTGAIGAFNMKPMRRGLSWTSRNTATACPQFQKFVDNIGLNTKTISGPGLTTKTWSINYGPPNGCYTGGVSECTASSPVTRTVDVQGPESTFTRFTFGNKYRDTDGMLLRTQTGASLSSIARDEQMTWETIPVRGVSSGGGYLGSISRLEKTRTITQDGATYNTTNSNWDEYQKPRTIVESGPNGGSRTTQLTYYNNKSVWVIGEEGTTTSPGKSVSKTYNAVGSVATVTRNGVTTSYTYHPDGNVASIQYPRSLTHSFSSYKFGTAQSETQPEGVSKTRVVNALGYLVSETDGESHTTAYQYDVMGRVNLIDYPIGNDATITHTPLSSSITRGAMVETTTYDGLRRPTQVVTGGIAKTFEYDGYGRKTFESNPGDTIGTRTEYDSLGRPKKVTNADGTFRSFQYGVSSTVLTDERGKQTTHTYRAYGSPESQILVGITAPDATANVTIGRQPNGLLSSVTQAGITRSFGYDSRNFLTTETHPEVGTITYGRDDAGNMTSKKVGTATTTFGYDGQNRLATITYSDGTPSVTNVFTKTGKVKTTTSSVAVRTFGYDANDNLKTESLSIDAQTLTASYAYTGNDQLSSITYPVSGRVVSYAPDALGRPTQVSGYVTNVTYWPSGLPQQVTYANGLVTQYGQHARLWPSAFSTRRGSVYYVNSSYGYDNAGNLTSTTDTADAQMSRTSQYDDLNRLTVASGPWGSGTISYDGAGNIRSQALGSFALNYNYDTQNRLASISGARSATYSYNVHGSVASNGSMTFAYDGAPNLTCANCAAGNRTDFRYDGLNNRVKLTRAGVTTYEFYGNSGSLLVSYTPSQASRLIEYLYLGGKRIAQRVSDTAAATSITPIATTLLTNASGGVTLGVNLGGTAPSGTVTFSRAGTALGTAYVASKQASVEVLGLAAGAHTITATYSGDGINAGNSLAFGITVIDTKPSSITVPTSSLTGSYTISWGTGGGTVTAYQLYEATNASFTGQISAYSGTGTSVALSGRGNGTYYYRVRACNGATCSAYRAGANPTVVTLAPGTPTTLTAPATSATGGYSISWTVASGTVTAYELYEATNSAFTGEVKVYTGTGTSTALSGRTDGTYYYRVRACNGAACSGYRAAGNPTTVTLPPGVPASISVPATSPTGSYSISWGVGSGTITAYELYEATNSAFTGQALVYSGTATSTGLSGRTDGSYYYRVRSCNVSGCSGYRSGSNAISVILPPGAPGSISVPSSSPNGSYTISWGGASGSVLSYQLYEATNSGFSGETLVYNAGGLSTGFSGKANGSYYYRVRACNASGCSGFATGANAVTVAALQATVNPGHWNYYVMRGDNPIIDPPVVVTATGGTGGYTYAWERVSGDGSITAQTPTASSTKWTRTMSGWDVVWIAYWRCLVRDSAGNTTYTPQIQVEFEREDHL